MPTAKTWQFPGLCMLLNLYLRLAAPESKAFAKTFKTSRVWFGSWVVQEMLKRGPVECKPKLTKQLSSTNDQKNALWNDPFGRHVAQLLKLNMIVF